MKLSHCINYLLAISQHEVFQTFSDRLSDFGITPGQYGVLCCLWQSETGSATPKEIAATLRLETSTVSGSLDKMEKQGLIARSLDPNNRRSIRVHPVGKGAAIRDDVLRAVEELNDTILTRFTPQERQSLLTYLKRVGKTAD